MSKVNASSTQEHLPIAGIQDDVIMMASGGLRAVLKVEPVNFELKSETEQNGIIYGYQGFLNSLEFPIQIVIHSKKLDLENYLVRLEATKKNMTSELLRIQTEDYVDFVRRLITVANIMAKRFYVVVEYTVAGKGAAALNPFSGLFHSMPSTPILDQETFARYRTEVINRANLVGAGLSHLGIRVSLLETQQLIELFYGIYNPDIATEERLTNIEELSGGVITAPAVAAPVEPATAPTPSSQPDQPPSQPSQ